MEFKQKLDIYTKKINGYLKNVLDRREGKIYEAARYSLLAGGKRIRPVLTLGTCETLGAKGEEALCFGCALEMIHTYSLIHDDLPCMDNDDLRRGKPTNHKVFGEATAVLAGDELLNLACETVVNGGLDAALTVNALRIIYTASGAEGMIGGQVMDMESENRRITETELTMLHRKKTGALINAAVSLGALCAGRDENMLHEYSCALGLAFQIRDDILDIEGDAEKFGKPICSDEKNGKSTFVTEYGMDGAKKRLLEETQRATESLNACGIGGGFLSQLAEYLLKREN